MLQRLQAGHHPHNPILGALPHNTAIQNHHIRILRRLARRKP